MPGGLVIMRFLLSRMKMNRIISTTAVALTVILAQPVIADGAEIKVWTA
jgi:hypothetical protein